MRRKTTTTTNDHQHHKPQTTTSTTGQQRMIQGRNTGLYDDEHKKTAQEMSSALVSFFLFSSCCFLAITDNCFIDINTTCPGTKKKGKFFFGTRHSLSNATGVVLVRLRESRHRIRVVQYYYLLSFFFVSDFCVFTCKRTSYS